MMKTTQFPKKFLSLRDKSGSHRRSKSQEKDKEHKSRPSSELFWNLFKTEAAKQAAKEEEAKEKEAAKIEDISRMLVEKNIPGISTDHIRYTLRSRFADGNVDKAVDFIELQQRSTAGEILQYDPNVQMVGAENRGNVTCYIDSLLFAMFSKLEAFECMLKNQDYPDEARKKLVTLLRLWVNMLRSGRLIYTDMTQLIQETLAQCGWPDAGRLEQQDTSEAFAFITEVLQLPLLTLQVDLFHQGKYDSDDHKVVYERLLNLAVPEDPEGKGIKLEDCLEEYFNTKVDVLRDSHEEKKSMSLADPTRRTIRVVTEEDDDDENKASSSHLEMSPLPMTPVERRWSSTRPAPAAEDEEAGPSTSTAAVVPAAREAPPSRVPSSSRPEPRHRSTSVIQRIVLDEKGRPHTPTAESPSLLQQVTRKGSTIVKAVTIPAWQFFKLIPWHTTTNNAEPQNDAEVVREFNQRPVVSICLKRYLVASGRPKRHNTYIDIPDSLALPQFMMPDDKKVEEDPSGLGREYKLVLQSVVCHRGDSLTSGHYVAFARVAPKLLTDNRRHDFDPPPDYEEAQWVKFDDLNLEHRVSYVDDITQALRTEMPYLLFYQIVPTVEVACPPSTTTDTETEPPSYNASNVDVTTPPTPNPTDPNQLGILEPPADYFDGSTLASATSSLSRPANEPPSIRFSSEIEQPSRPSMSGDEDSYSYPGGSGQQPQRQGGASTSTGGDASRRGSVTFTDSTFGTPAVTPEGGASPAVTPGEGGVPAMTTTTQRFSRAKERLVKGTGAGGAGAGPRSRPASQVGENRISTTMTRLSGLMRASKEPLRDAANGLTASVTAPAATTTTAGSGFGLTVAAPSSVAGESDPGAAVSTVTTGESLVDGDACGHKHHNHHSHKGKSKSKAEKEKAKKAANPPERECSLM